MNSPFKEEEKKKTKLTKTNSIDKKRDNLKHKKKLTCCFPFNQQKNKSYRVFLYFENCCIFNENKKKKQNYKKK